MVSDEDRYEKELIEQEVVISRLLNDLQNMRRLVWLLIKSAGGEIHVLDVDVMDFDEKKAIVEKAEHISRTIHVTTYKAKVKGEGA